jgi:heterodisulfide reductase subunit A
LNPYRCECANIREQVSWVHQQEKQAATQKAIAVACSIVEKVKGDWELKPLSYPLNRRALVIGAGIAGIKAALEIAGAGYPTILVEQQATLGGRMAQLSGTYLNFSAAPELLQILIAQVYQHPNIQVIHQAQVEDVFGYVGNFKVRVGQTNSDLRFEFDIGGIVVATGWEPFDRLRLPEYGAVDNPDVIDTLDLERMLRPGGEVRRSSDGRAPREIVFVQCAGSRDPEHGVPYCSKVCCMVVAKQAMQLRQRLPGSQVYVFYIDIRSAGKGYDEFVQRVMEEGKALYLRGKVSKIFREGGQTMVWGVDTLSGRPVEIAADLVVLATPMLPSASAAQLARRLHISVDASGFFNEAHPKLRPVETLTAGIFLAGAAQGPKDIPESVLQAGAAAAKVIQLFSQDQLAASPQVASVIPELCAACGVCVEVCPYGARSIHPIWRIAAVNAALCQSCGACAVACPNKASQVHNWRPDQVLGMIEQLMDR